MKEASDAGQRSIEHASSILRDIPFPSSDSPEAEVLASQTATDIFNTLKRNHTVVVPTLSYDWTRLGVARRDPVTCKNTSCRENEWCYRRQLCFSRFLTNQNATSVNIRSFRLQIDVIFLAGHRRLVAAS